MTPTTPRNAPMPRLASLLTVVALAVPVTGFADTSVPQPAIGIVPANEQVVEHHGEKNPGKPGRHGEHGGVQPVPEPGTFALLAMGAVAAGIALRNRKQRQAPTAGESNSTH